MKKLFAVMALVLIAQAAAVYAADGLEGSVWKATFNDGSKMEDTLVFVKGQFISTKCVPYGYGSSSYSSSDMKDGAQWQAQQSSGKDKTSWTGQVSGDSMTGKFMHMQANGTKTTQDWTATKQQ